MFERYSERARRLIFFARYEAAQLASPAIDTEHLLLGLLREGKGLVRRVLERHGISLADLRGRIVGDAIATSASAQVDIPLTAAAQRVLMHAAEEADRGHHELIAVEHVLLGLLREEGFASARILADAGLTLEQARQDVATLAAVAPPPPAAHGPAMPKLVQLLNAIEERGYPYRMSHPSRETIRVEVTRPRERWEIDLAADGRVEVRVFTAPAVVEGEEALKRLFEPEG